MNPLVTILPGRNTGNSIADDLAQQLGHWRDKLAASERSAGKWQGVLENPADSPAGPEHINARAKLKRNVRAKLKRCETRIGIEQRRVDGLTIYLADLGYVLV